MERKVTITWIVLMVLCLGLGVAGVVFFSLPYDQAVSAANALVRDATLISMTRDQFTSFGQPARWIGALFLAAGLGLLLMPVRTRSWLRRLVYWINKARG